MNTIRKKLEHFMYGRYGSDQLNIALLAVYFILLIVNLFTRNLIFDVLLWAVFAWTAFRTLSRNIYKRQKENHTFLKYWSIVNSGFKLFVRRIREFRTHRFRKCPQCKTVLRLPRRIGKHTVRCPKCQNRFKIRVLI